MNTVFAVSGVEHLMIGKISLEENISYANIPDSGMEVISAKHFQIYFFFHVLK